MSWWLLYRTESRIEKRGPPPTGARGLPQSIGHVATPSSFTIFYGGKLQLVTAGSHCLIYSWIIIIMMTCFLVWNWNWKHVHHTLLARFILDAPYLKTLFLVDFFTGIDVDHNNTQLFGKKKNQLKKIKELKSN